MGLWDGLRHSQRRKINVTPITAITAVELLPAPGEGKAWAVTYWRVWDVSSNSDGYDVGLLSGSEVIDAQGVYPGGAQNGVSPAIDYSNQPLVCNPNQALSIKALTGTPNYCYVVRAILVNGPAAQAGRTD